MGQFRKVLFWLTGLVGDVESTAISASILKLKLTEAELGKMLTPFSDQIQIFFNSASVLVLQITMQRKDLIHPLPFSDWIYNKSGNHVGD